MIAVKKIHAVYTSFLFSVCFIFHSLYWIISLLSFKTYHLKHTDHSESATALEERAYNKTCIYVVLLQYNDISLLWHHCNIDGNCIEKIKSVLCSSLYALLICYINQYGFFTFFFKVKFDLCHKL